MDNTFETHITEGDHYKEELSLISYNCHKFIFTGQKKCFLVKEYEESCRFINDLAAKKQKTTMCPKMTKQTLYEQGVKFSKQS